MTHMDTSSFQYSTPTSLASASSDTSTFGDRWCGARWSAGESSMIHADTIVGVWRRDATKRGRQGGRV
jgi:hypothetical protein